MVMYLLQSIKNIRGALVRAVVKSHVDVASRRNLRDHVVKPHVRVFFLGFGHHLVLSKCLRG